MDESAAIRPYQIDIPQSSVDDLHERLRRTRWPDFSAGSDWARGVPPGYLATLTDYWLNDFDWRAQEARLNAIPQFVTTVDGQDIHFFHVRSSESDAMPLMLTHGWPSSSVEFLRVLEPLADPQRSGGQSTDAFDVVVPTLPGYGLSTPFHAGWGNLFQVAQAWAELARRLGYERYGLQATDAGAGVAGMLAMIAPGQVVGMHLTGTSAGTPFGPALDPDDFDGADRDRIERFNKDRDEDFGYFHLQATRPQTIAYALTDSPVGQLAWIVEKFHEWTDPAAELPDEAVDRDQLLTNVSLNWFRQAGATSAHATYEGIQAWKQMAAAQTDGAGHGSEGSELPEGPPTGYAVFAADTTVRSLADPEGSLAHWSNFDRGGHFPAMEVPDLWVSDVREFFRPLRGLRIPKDR
ncbi:epoxide hydrolase [Mumia sp. zg.B21]|uniref:epoxide hydrolase family protein n=1 Tax=Mumia sp. zg.B21 TaxID=2855447 RepID=UPI001C6DFCC5|nr:epoxide hydrolase family protein [Mumia sp. zg.B21]MBW9209021.1 epoxide hydrolase [Mumia sp. zg.B21]